MLPQAIHMSFSRFPVRSKVWMSHPFKLQPPTEFYRAATVNRFHSFCITMSSHNHVTSNGTVTGVLTDSCQETICVVRSKPQFSTQKTAFGENAIIIACICRYLVSEYRLLTWTIRFVHYIQLLYNINLYQCKQLLIIWINVIQVFKVGLIHFRICLAA